MTRRVEPRGRRGSRVQYACPVIAFESTKLTAIRTTARRTITPSAAGSIRHGWWSKSACGACGCGRCGADTAPPPCRCRKDTPVRTFFAPGRVNLIGEYTDLVGGLVLPVAIEPGITLRCEPAPNTRLSSRDGPPGWQRYVDAVVHELDALGRGAVGLRGELTSTLPIGAGLSSSAALEVVVGIALCALAEFDLEPLELAQALRRAEHRAVGVPSGIMDQAASLLGRRRHAVLLDTGTLEYEHIPLPADL